MRSAAKKYNTNYKKRIDVFHDTFLPRRSPAEIIQCSGCGAFYHRRRWSLTAPPGFSPSARRHGIFCPACQKIKAHSVSGEVHLRGVAERDRGEVLRLLRNEEAQAREKNPLERIMLLAAAGDGWRVENHDGEAGAALGPFVAQSAWWQGRLQLVA